MTKPKVGAVSAALQLKIGDHDPILLTTLSLPITIRNGSDWATYALVSLATRLGCLDLGHWFRNNSAAFLTAHPHCRIGIRDEYGHEHQITEGTDR